VITVDRKVVEVGGHLYVEAPKNRKFRRTVYPRLTPDGYPLSDKLAARIEAARAEQEAGANPLGLVTAMSWQVTVPMTEAANRSHSRHWVSACFISDNGRARLLDLTFVGWRENLSESGTECQ
jgi:hypothetical protein